MNSERPALYSRPLIECSGDAPGPALYVHFPWCQRKCPYCDFNSHGLTGELPEAAYTDALLLDLEASLASYPQLQPLETVFLGGGTPSLFSAAAIERLLSTVAPCLARNAEITMEANPGAVEHGAFSAYRKAGVNRLSLGVQSFSEVQLQSLGRIHGVRDIASAFREARAGGFDNINLDLMYGLPQQSARQALEDLRQALALEPEHLSWYQLTLEPGTAFHRHPPPLATDSAVSRMEDQGRRLLAERGYQRYEVSAYAKPGFHCRHNLTYWTFGDYLGIGAGAHGKAPTAGGGWQRTAKSRQPGRYMQDATACATPLKADELPAEFMLNALRLTDGVPESLFARRTGLDWRRIADTVSELRRWELMRRDRLALTARGMQLLDEVVARFL